MALIALFIGAILIVSAFRNTQGQLASALEQDIPGFLVWAAALFAVGVLGYVPGLEKPSRYLLALVLLVIILKNYSTILPGFTLADSASATAAPTTPGATAESQATQGGVGWTGVPPLNSGVPTITNPLTGGFGGPSTVPGVGFQS